VFLLKSIYKGNTVNATLDRLKTLIILEKLYII